MNSSAIAGFRGSDEEWIPEGTTVDEELSPAAGRLGVARALDITAHPERASSVMNRHQGSGEITSPDGCKTLCRVLLRGDSQAAAAVNVQLEPGLGVRERQCRHRIVRRPRLTRGGTKELASGRRVEEQSAHGHRGSPLPCR